MNKLKFQYILAVALFFGGFLYLSESHTSNDFDNFTQYRSSPRVERKLAQQNSSSVSIKEGQSKKKRVNQRVHDSALQNLRSLPESLDYLTTSQMNKLEFEAVGSFSFAKNVQASIPPAGAQLPSNIAKIGNFVLSEGPGENSVVKENGRLGVFTNTLKLKLLEGVAASSIEEFRAKGEDKVSLAHLGIYHIRFEDRIDSIESYEAIKELGITERVSLETIFHFRQGR